MLWVFLVVVIMIWVLQRRWATRKQTALAKLLKTKIRTYPIIGQTYKLFGTDEDRMKAWKDFGRDTIEAGGVSKFIHFDQLLINVADPAVVEVVLSKCLDKHELMKLIEIVIGNASIVAPVPVWRHRRKIDASIFNTKNLVKFVEIFSAQSIAMANVLGKEAGNGKFSFLEYIEVSTMNTVCETTTGVKTNYRGSKFMHAVEELWQIAAYVMMCQPWIKNKFLLRFLPSFKTIIKHKQTVHDLITKIIREKQAFYRKSDHKHTEIANEKVLSFLDFQLQTSDSSRKFSEEELFEESVLLIAAGFDTTASSTAFTVLMLSRHPDIQDRVFEGLKDVFGDSDRPVTYSDLPRLKYLEAVIKETLRLYPTVPVVARHVDKDFELPSGMTVVKGCGILVNIWAVHRNPEYWGEDAEQFRPERFLDYTPKHPAAFMPFSYGPRGCIGSRYAMLLVKTELSTLLRRYRVLAPPGVPRGEPLRTKYEIIQRHVDNYEIQLERRK